ncbi:cytochrome P450 [Cladochytrium replicatum]|nr:cytochrome P450 [Cladochytrium replicatum]
MTCITISLLPPHMPLTTIGVLVAGLVVLGTLAFLRWRKRPIGCYQLHPSTKIHNAPLYPFIGHLPTLVKHDAVLHDYILKIFIESPETEALLIPFTEPLHFIKTPENLEYVLKTKFESFEKGPRFRENMFPILGHGIFNSDGEHWRTQRKTASHIFNVKNFREFVSIVIKKEMENFVDVLDQAVESNMIVDMQDLFFRFTLDSFAKLAFSIEFDNIKGKEQGKFARCFDRAQVNLTNRFYWPLWKWTEKTDAVADYEYVRSFGHEVVRKRREDIRNNATFSSADILQQFLIHGEQHGEEITDEQLVDYVLNFMIAGRDTTAQALSWTIYCLSKNPDAKARIFAEIETVGPITDLSYDEMKNRYPYVNAVLMETLRLYPSVPANIKVAVRDEVLPDGTVIPKGAAITWNVYSMGRTPRIWGDDAAKFRPERWFEFTTQPSDFKFPAFQAGPRLCLGKRLATIEAIYVIVSLFHKFDVNVENIDEVRYANSVTLPMAVPIKCSIQRRSW